MSTEVDHPNTLEQRITQRLHDTIGDLVTEADLKGMVERGIEECLFKPRSSRDSYGRSDTKPPLVHELVDMYVKSRMEAAIDVWLKAHPEQIQEAIDKAMVKGAANCVQEAMDWRFSNIFTQGVNMLKLQGYLPRPPGM